MSILGAEPLASRAISEWATEPEEWSTPAMLSLARLAVGIYEDEHGWSTWGPDRGGESPQWWSRGAAQFGVVDVADVTVIAYRGTLGLMDWLADARVLWPVEWPPPITAPEVRVHRGFAGQARCLADDTTKVAERAQRNGRPLVLVGHSLGGALAGLDAARLEGLGLPVAAVAAFCAPRAGNKAWAEHCGLRDAPGGIRHTGLSARTRRVVVVERGRQDIVTRIPLSRWGWWHYGHADIIADGTRYYGERAWEEVRSMDGTSLLASLRIYTRLRRATRAHFGETLLSSLRYLERRETGGI